MVLQIGTFVSSSHPIRACVLHASHTMHGPWASRAACTAQACMHARPGVPSLQKGHRHSSRADGGRHHSDPPSRGCDRFGTARSGTGTEVRSCPHMQILHGADCRQAESYCSLGRHGIQNRNCSYPDCLSNLYNFLLTRIILGAFR